MILRYFFNAGFTLIELVIVIAIIGILTAVAVPKFIDLSTEAKLQAVRSTAGSLAVGGSNNYLVRKLDPASGFAVSNCTDAGDLLKGGLPSGYTIVSSAISEGVTATCTVVSPGGSTLESDEVATFTITGIA